MSEPQYARELAKRLERLTINLGHAISKTENRSIAPREVLWEIR